MSDADQIPMPLRDPDAPKPTLAELAREARICKTWGKAIDRCAVLGGLDLDKQALPNGMDKARYSRILSGAEGIKWPQLETILVNAGNDLPLLWALHQRGWDVTTLRRLESETERELRETKEELARERQRRIHSESFVAGVINQVSSNVIDMYQWRAAA